MGWAVKFKVAELKKTAVCRCLPLNAVVLVLGVGVAPLPTVASLVVLLQKAVLHQVYVAFVVAPSVVVVALGALWRCAAKRLLKAARRDETVWHLVCRMRFM